VSGNDHGQCLTEETLTDYLEGGLEPAVKAASEVHLLACDACRSKLAFWMRLLQQDVTQEEADTLGNIRAEWEKQTVSSPVPRKNYVSGRLLLAVAAVVMIAVAALSIWLLRQRSSEPRSAGEVVQLLLDQNRPFESRLAGERYQAIRRTRGSTSPEVSYNLLAGEMTRLAATSHEMGRFYLLQKQFSRAVSYLEIAEREVGAGAAVHNDLGVAYLENGSPAQLQKAGAEFSHALRDDPKFAAAAFNLALFYERTNATSQAQAQWKKYLELDPSSEWAQEARERLQGLSR